MIRGQAEIQVDSASAKIGGGWGGVFCRAVLLRAVGCFGRLRRLAGVFALCVRLGLVEGCGARKVFLTLTKRGHLVRSKLHQLLHLGAALNLLGGLGLCFRCTKFVVQENAATMWCELQHADSQHQFCTDHCICLYLCEFELIWWD